MKTTGQRRAKVRDGVLLRIAVLVPHRDIRPALYSLRRRIFAAGIPGAYSFPPVVPLALLERPLPDSELKALAASLRTLSLETGGVFTVSAAGPPSLIGGPGGFSFWGFPLNIPVPPLPGALSFPRAALCAAAAGTDTETEREILLKTGGPPLPHFRAAAAANLAVKFFPADGRVPGGESTLPGLSSRWRIGKPCWLKKASGNVDGQTAHYE
ncbi:MAG: hypothetical protein LBP80_11285 [Treponema sp.]|jgi:hypothetical protein|nr:hypothetical protein [Treponema sp.]